MKKTVLSGLIIVCSVIIIISFFMPWARANVSVTKVADGLASAADDELKDSPFAGKFIKELQKATKAVNSFGDIEVKTTVSGYDIPTLVNKKSSRSALSLAEIFFKSAEGLDKKSLLVYLLPLFAIISIFFAVLGLKNRLFVAATAMIGAVISVYGFYSLLTRNLSGTGFEVVVLNGLWQTMFGYLFIFALSVVWLVNDARQ